MEDAIRTHRLTRIYSGRKVVDHLNLRVPVGCVYGLLGRNGAGKSTTLKMLAGMVHPDGGRAELLGHDAHALPPAVRGRVAYIPEGHPLYGWMTVGEVARFAAALNPRTNRQQLNVLLDHFGLLPRWKISRLSRGQRGQVALALAVAPDPDLLLLDDPTLGLDPAVRMDFLESIVGLVQRKGRTILFSTHTLSDVERLADRVGVMVDGVLRVDCPTEHFKQAVRRVVVQFAQRPVALPTLAGLLGESFHGNRVELVFVDFGTAQRGALEALSPRRIEVEEMNLEDAFVAYTRPTRCRVPLGGDDLVFSHGGQDHESTGVQGAA